MTDVEEHCRCEWSSVGGLSISINGWWQLVVEVVLGYDFALKEGWGKEKINK